MTSSRGTPHLSPQISFTPVVSIPNPIPSLFPNLRRFVGHLWATPYNKFFVAVVRTESAPTVVVEMKPRGGGRRTGWQDCGGYGGGDRGYSGDSDRGGFGGGDRGGFGGGRQDHTQDRTSARGNVWQRKQKIVEMHEDPTQAQDQEGELPLIQATISDNSKWEAQVKKQEEKSDTWAPRHDQAG